MVQQCLASQHIIFLCKKLYKHNDLSSWATTGVLCLVQGLGWYFYDTYFVLALSCQVSCGLCCVAAELTLHMSNASCCGGCKQHLLFLCNSFTCAVVCTSTSKTLAHPTELCHWLPIYAAGCSSNAGRAVNSNRALTGSSTMRSMI